MPRNADIELDGTSAAAEHELDVFEMLLRDIRRENLSAWAEYERLCDEHVQADNRERARDVRENLK